MDRHAHPELRQFLLERALGGDGCLHRTKGVGKSRAERIAHRLEDVAVVGSDRLVEEGVVTGERFPHRLGLLLPEAGAAFDVGEEKRDGASG
jgi:hypothetical protein